MSTARAGPLNTVMARVVMVLAVAGAAVAGVAAVGAAAGSEVDADGSGGVHRAVTVRDADGGLLVRVPLEGERFAVSYRNSIYGTLAEERYAVSGDGRFQVVELAADQLAVLEEYYALPGPAQRTTEVDRRTWRSDPDPERPAVFTSLSIAATDLGERTLLVPGQPPLPLWQLVADDNPTVALGISAVLDPEESS